jgi:RHS repeat-associated protein
MPTGIRAFEQLDLALCLCLFLSLTTLPRASSIELIYKWNPQTKDYSLVNDGEHLPAGTVLWIKAATSTTLHLTGEYADPRNAQIAEPGYFPVPGLQVQRTTNALPSDASLAHFDEALQRWRVRVGRDPGLASELPAWLAPGEALFVHPAAPAEIQAPDPSLRMRYYHLDHLGSSSALTDGSGSLIGETAFYPFGSRRNQFFPGSILDHDYLFTGKERDSESGLSDHGARFCAPVLSRFLSVDPLFAAPTFLPNGSAFAALVSSPQKANLYSFALNNPVKYSDPAGLEPTEETQGGLVLEGDSKDVTALNRLLESEAKRSSTFRGVLERIRATTDYKTALSVGRDNAPFVDSGFLREVDLNDIENLPDAPSIRNPSAFTRGEALLHILVEYHELARLERLNPPLPGESALQGEKRVFELAHETALKEQRGYRKDRKIPDEIVGTKKSGDVVTLKLRSGADLRVTTTKGKIVSQRFTRERVLSFINLPDGPAPPALLEGIGEGHAVILP